MPDASLRGADLSEADLTGAKLWRADLTGADFSAAKLTGANLREADLSGTILEGTLLKDTNLRGVNGLTKEQLEAFKSKGAIIDEDPTASSSQSTTVPPSPAQRNDAQVQSTPGTDS